MSFQHTINRLVRIGRPADKRDTPARFLASTLLEPERSGDMIEDKGAEPDWVPATDAMELMLSVGFEWEDGWHELMGLARLGVVKARAKVLEITRMSRGERAEVRTVEDSMIPAYLWEPYASYFDPPTGEYSGRVYWDGGKDDFVARRVTFDRAGLSAHFDIGPPPSAEIQVRTGSPGRPTKGFPFYMAEHKRRRETGEAEEGVAAEARYLEAWYRQNHPDKDPCKAQTIENNIRSDHNAYKRAKQSRGVKLRPTK